MTVLLWRPVLAKPELLVFCGPESGAARLPHNLGFVLAMLLARQLSCRSLLVFSVDRSHASSSGVDQRGVNVFCGCAESFARHCRMKVFLAGLGFEQQRYLSVLQARFKLPCAQ